MRAADLDCWSWLVGMRSTCGRRVSSVKHGPTGIKDDDTRVRPDNSALPADAQPDLDDLGTCGLIAFELLPKFGWRLKIRTDGKWMFSSVGPLGTGWLSPGDAVKTALRMQS